MCGIAGTYLFQASPDLEQEHARRVRAMARALVHRGPDDDGFEQDERFALGFDRLAILDLSPLGNQPHRTADGQILSLLNGEIYNYRALRKELEDAGIRLRSSGDTEVVPHLYRRHGDAFVEKLEGMFAIAIVDRARSRLVLARDRFGKKPLYFRADEMRIEFASEPAALLANGEAFAPDPAALLRFLAFGYVPGSQSAFAGIERLAPGEMLVAENGKVARRRWYTQPPSDASRSNDSLEDAAARTWELLVLAVADRFASDVPLGVFLSGGIDSGLITAAARAGGYTPRAYTIGFADRSHDERELTRASARHLQVDLVERELDLDPSRALDLVAAAFDEPFGDSSAYPTLLLCEETRRDVTVALSGDGGDESFAGYKRYRSLAQLERVDRAVPAFLRHVLSSALAEPGNGVAGRSLVGQFRRFATALSFDSATRDLYWSGFFLAPLRARFLHRDFLGAAAAADPDREFASLFANASGSPLRRALEVDFERYLPDDLLVKTDRASMARSLEVRCPFLDRRIVEFAHTLPDAVLLAGGRTKAVLRDLARSKLPPEVASAPKRGFGVPLAKWLRGPLRALVEGRLLGAEFAARRILKDGAARELISRHLSGREDWSSYLWLLLVLDAWFRRFEGR